jgi:hypothetical protein
MADIIVNAPNQADLSSPDNTTVIWPKPRDPKIDIATIIETSLQKLGIGDVPVIKEGSFKSSLLQYCQNGCLDACDCDKVSRPVVTVSRASDKTVRMAIGRLIGEFAANDPALLDPDAQVAPDGVVDVHGEHSDAQIDVVINDLNGPRADQMYQIIKLSMIAALQVFMDVGYIDIKRVGGGDLAPLEIDSPVPGLVSSRTLTYECRYPDYIATLPTLVHLVKQSMTIEPGGAQTSTLLTDIYALSLGAGAVISTP